MAELLKFTTEEGPAVLINLDRVTRTGDGEEDELTTVYFADGDEVEVKERIELILEKGAPGAIRFAACRLWLRPRRRQVR